MVFLKRVRRCRIMFCILRKCFSRPRRCFCFMLLWVPISKLFLVVILLLSTTLLIGEPDVYGGFPLQDVSLLKFNNNQGVLARLSTALKYPTISLYNNEQSNQATTKLVHYINTSFPYISSSPYVTTDIIKAKTLIYTIKGTRSNIPPYLLLTHTDVAPVSSFWKHHPFGGEITKDGFIKGRGTIQSKSQVMGILEALSELLSTGYRPKRTFYIVFTHDKETGGKDGTARAVEYLMSKGVEDLDFILTSGTFILNDGIAGVTNPTAMIAVSEKGYLDMELTVNGSSGHVAVTTEESTILILARALNNLLLNPHPNMFGQNSEISFFKYVAYKSDWMYRIIYSNLWLFSWLFRFFTDFYPPIVCKPRTTTAVTMYSAGIKPDLMPPVATATVNHYIHPGSTVKQAIQHDITAIADSRVATKILREKEPSSSSPYGPNAPGFTLIAASIKQVLPRVIIAPTVMTDSSDSYYFTDLSDSIYRFTPIQLSVNQTTRLRGENECITIQDYYTLINFYYRLILNAEHVKIKTQLHIVQ